MLLKLPVAIGGMATLAYPLVVYLGYGAVEPVWLASALFALVMLRAWASRDARWLWAAAGTALLAVASVAGGSWIPLKLYPVLVCAVLFVVFFASVLRPPTVIERIARLGEPDLPAAGVRYTRAVTLLWCAFFLFNGAIALFLALRGSNEAWALYTGLISYVLMGSLFVAEWLVRQRVKARMARVSNGEAHG
jgi:uncharacterized membrane protein